MVQGEVIDDHNHKALGLGRPMEEGAIEDSAGLQDTPGSLIILLVGFRFSIDPIMIHVAYCDVIVPHLVNLSDYFRIVVR